MKRVEAMIQPLRSDNHDTLPRPGYLEDAIDALGGYLGGFEGELDERPKPELSEIVRLAKEIENEFNRFADQLEEHDCSDADQSLIPVGSNEPLDTLLRREGFISADMVAIVKLNDVAPIVNKDGLLPCPFCAWPTPQITEVNDNADGATEFVFVQCQECRGSTGELDSRAEAIATWNKRGVA